MTKGRRQRTYTLSLYLVSLLVLAPLFSESYIPSRSSVQRGHSLPGNLPKHLRNCSSGRVPTAALHPTVLAASIDGDDLISSKLSTRTFGIFVLLTVPLAWGTFEPAVRYVYAIDPPVPSLVFTVGYYSVASITLSLLALTSILKEEERIEESQSSDNEISELKDHKRDALPILGGIELGFYLFLGNGLQVLGLKTVNSDRAAFLLQLTTIMVPLVQAIFAGNMLAVPVRTWFACFVALGGVTVMSLDGQELMVDGSTFDPLNGTTQGDLLIVLAAFSYTFHCIRLGRYAKETTPIKLASSKAITETLLSAALLTVIMLVGTPNQAHGNILDGSVEARNEIVSFSAAVVEGISSGSMSSSVLLPTVGAVLWTGWVTIAYTITAQSYGQRLVNPTDANLIYTVQPIFTALFAWFLLGETLGPAGFAGGALIGSAVYLVASDDDGDFDEGLKKAIVQDRKNLTDDESENITAQETDVLR